MTSPPISRPVALVLGLIVAPGRLIGGILLNSYTKKDYCPFSFRKWDPGLKLYNIKMSQVSVEVVLVSYAVTL